MCEGSADNVERWMDALDEYVDTKISKVTSPSSDERDAARSKLFGKRAKLEKAMREALSNEQKPE